MKIAFALTICRCRVFSTCVNIPSSDLNVLLFRKESRRAAATRGPIAVVRPAGVWFVTRAVRVNPVAGAVAFGSRPCRARSSSRSPARSRRPGRFPLTRAAAARYRERRGRAIGRARPFPGATSRAARKPRVRSKSPAAISVASASRRVRFARVSRFAPVGFTASDRKAVTLNRQLEIATLLIFVVISSFRWNSDRRGNDRHCATCASRRQRNVQ